MEADTVQPEIEQEEVFEQPIAVEDTAADSKETHVPLAALQKERKKRQELEYENQLLKTQYVNQAVPQQVDDDTQYETVTKADLGKYSEELVRSLDEKHWVKHNPEKAQKVNEYLSEFLKQKPYLAEALKHAPNRYEEAWELMNALSPKQQTALTKQQPQKREGPGPISSAPKAAAMNQAVDVMNMSDDEFYAWRQSQKKRR